MTIFRFSIRACIGVSVALSLGSPLAAQELIDDDTKLMRADRILNQVYQTRMKRLPPADRIALRNAERRWLSDVSQRCEHIADRAAMQATVMGPGAAAQSAETLCRLDATEKRIVVLRKWKTKK